MTGSTRLLLYGILLLRLSMMSSSACAQHNIQERHNRIPETTGSHAMSFFTGSWRLKAWLSGTKTDSPDISATWAVASVLENAFCPSGHVELSNGKIFTRELIAFNPAQGVFVRTIAANDSSCFTFTTKGWAGDSLTWLGTQAVLGQTIPIKQEIRAAGDDSFRAVFYVLRKGKWVVVMREELERM